MTGSDTNGEGAREANVDFYDRRRHETYRHEQTVKRASDHDWYPALRAFIREHRLQDKRCLEIGSGNGVFQDMVEDYTGTDVAESIAERYHKPYVVARGGRYPFEDASFDAIWTITVFEHIPELQTALEEVKRLLKPGGVVFFAPAWQCRPWAADGYEVRPFSDFDWKGKLIKASIPVRDHVLWRSLFIFPKRVARHLAFLRGRRFRELLYEKIEANWDTYWVTDADACNSIDPHDAILWFSSNGFDCVSHPSHLRAFLVRTGGLVFKKR